MLNVWHHIRALQCEVALHRDVDGRRGRHGADRPPAERRAVPQMIQLLIQRTALLHESARSTAALDLTQFGIKLRLRLAAFHALGRALQ